jgi:hypothetical protein
LKEISGAIETLCPDQPRIVKCDQESNLEHLWKSYQQQLLGNSCCQTSVDVQRILSFQVDYNEFLKH